MRMWVILASLGLSACGGSSVGASSGHLDELGIGDDPYPTVRGDRCNLATQNSEGSGILLVAYRDAAVVRVDGEPVRLRFQGDNLRRGGRFAGEGVSIEIGGISAEMASRDPPVGLPAVVGVQRGDSVEDFEATWTCGIRYPAPRTA
jgi:hypothetical protein